MFQSLSGFQVRCNVINLVRDTWKNIVSIPIGFSSSLQPPWWRSALRRSPCFNPYRVFKFVATSIDQGVMMPSIGFNPYRVFKFVATSRLEVVFPGRSICFNPYRVFKFVATLGVGVGSGLFFVFQSLSGFQVRCNAPRCGLLYESIGVFQSLSGFQVRCNIQAELEELFPE